MPDAFVLAHQPSRLMDDYDHPLPDIGYLIDLHETLMQPFKPAKVLGINLYSKDMSSEESQNSCESIYAKTGLPVEDMMKSPKGIVAEKVLRNLFPEQNI